MKYIVYITVNKESKFNGLNRIYIGVHKTENPYIFDGYLGDGVQAQQASSFKNPKSPFQYAVKKYGVKAFERITLFIYDTPKEAYQKLHDIIKQDFLNKTHVYNIDIDYSKGYKPLYQFDLKGKVIKKWENAEDCYDFYGYPVSKFNIAKETKLVLLNSFWANTPTIKVAEYSIKDMMINTFLYSKEGKLLKEFVSKEDCAKYINCTVKDIINAMRNFSLIHNQYYVINKLVDEFIPKCRRQYIHQTFYVYKEDNTYLGIYKGKEVMRVLDNYSWARINNIFAINNGWYKDFYVSLTPVNKVPKREIKSKLSIDVYDKYGNFIEHINSIKTVKEKYAIPASKLKNIQQGNKYFKDYIFKYSK